MKSKTLQAPTARVLQPLLVPSRYKAIYGGRGALKSWFFAWLACDYAMRKPGFRMVCFRETKESINYSAKLLIEDTINRYELPGFRILKHRIETPGDGFIIAKGLQDYNINTIKSFENFDVSWCEESEETSALSLEKLRPTFRNDTAELWFSWNPRSASDPVDKFFRGINLPDRSIVVRTNYKDNPWFPKNLEADRQFDLINIADRYDHVWEGGYEPSAIGAIWNRENLHSNRRDKPPRLTKVVVAVDPAVSNKENSDENGIVVVGLGDDQRGYVLEDLSLKGSPIEWAANAIAAFDKWNAETIVIEVNQGGDMVKHTLQTIRPSIPCSEVRGVRGEGKPDRAIPISALYTLGRISHVGTYSKLEDQMCKMTSRGYSIKTESPDRLDALVWGFSHLFPRMREEKKIIKRVPIPDLERMTR